MDIQKKLSHVEFLNREYNVSHLSYEREMAFFQSIKDGDPEEAKRLFKPFNSEDMGKLSDDSLRNLKYHLTITVAFITRYCIEGGMEMEAAYNLSDIYIRSIDKCRTEDEINLLHREVVDDYAQRMQLIRKQNRYPRSVTVCLDYIYDNLHTKISLEKLAEITALSPAYLSKLFHKEVGMTVSAYITKKRIEAAENMLKFSEYSCLEISDYLCFSSESHFIQVFRKHTGYTPKSFRERFFRTRKPDVFC
ncbi:MAG: helix-turn-helix domain-containing protein [Ruminococcaceae bacterium]|nr:helix-turn-helix domain-containing protein [Oscillospiraceae bacterium]MBE6902428.1 helix-turn-helix domain-containing protein [Oscillospiraceae bacterium]